MARVLLVATVVPSSQLEEQPDVLLLHEEEARTPVFSACFSRAADSCRIVSLCLW